MSAVLEISGIDYLRQYEIPAVDWLVYVRYYNFRKERERKEIEKFRRSHK